MTSKKHRRPAWRISRTRRATLAATAMALGTAVPAYAQEKDDPVEARKALPTITVTGDAGETATGPVTGFVARRGGTATKTDTPLIETPQAISVVTRDQMEAQSALTLRETTNYTASVVSSYFDSRVDSFKVRGGDATQYLDGLLRTYGTYNSSKLDPYMLERVELLRGPSSVLYGQGDPGAIVDIQSKLANGERVRQIEMQLGDYARKQIAFDIGDKIDKDGTLSYRFVGVGRDGNSLMT